MNENVGILKAEGVYASFTPVELRGTQYVLKNKACAVPMEELIELRNHSLEGTAGEWTSRSNVLSSVRKTAIEWHGSLFSVVHRKEGTLLMLAEKWFINKLLEDARTLYILRFKQEEMLSLWAIVDETSAATELKYSTYFTNTLKIFDSFYCDFMVFSEDEIKKINLPDSAEIIRI